MLTRAGGRGDGEAGSVFTLGSGEGEGSRFIFGVSSRLIAGEGEAALVLRP